jgi:nucleoside-diphosphate-sugar epimerase
MDLITGGTGFIGSCLAKTLLEQRRDVATLDIKATSPMLQPFQGRWRHFQGNLGNLGEVLTAVSEARPETIYHLGGMLSMPSEQNPQASFQTNMVGTYNVLEAARLFGVRQVLYSSTNGTFGLDLQGLDVIDDNTLQRPFTIYGVGKLFGELIGRYYTRRYGLDFRSIRLPAVVGPGAKTKNVSIYNAWAIEKSFFGEPYEIFVEPEIACPVIYFKDVARAFLSLAETPKEKIKTMNYLIVGVTPMPKAKNLAGVIESRLPQAKLSYKSEKLAMDFHKMSQGVRWDEKPAVTEWGWRPRYGLEEMVDDFIMELTEHPEWYE